MHSCRYLSGHEVLVARRYVARILFTSGRCSTDGRTQSPRSPGRRARANRQARRDRGMTSTSLGTRVVLVSSAVLSLLVLFAGTWIERQLTDAMRAEEVRQAKLHAGTLLGSLQTLMLNGQGTLARSWLDRMHGEAGIVDIEVMRRDGSEAFTDLSTVHAVNDFLGQPRFQREPTIARHAPEAELKFFQRALQGELAVDWTTPGQMSLFMPIEARAECLACHGYENNSLRGVLKLALSTVAAETRIDAMRDQVWVVSAALVVLLRAAIWLALRVSVLRPSARLRDAIRRVGEGDRDAKLPIVRRDELGEVAEVFNRMQDQLVASEIRVRAVMDNVLDAIVTIDDKGLIEPANQAVRHVFGYTPEELRGQNVNILMPEPYRSEHDAHIARYLQTGESRILGVGRELSGLRKNGTVFPMDLAVSEMWGGDKRFFIGIARDITERKEQTAAIEYQALHDALTDLPNRSLLSDRLHQGILSAARQQGPLALIIMDLDHIKEINDTLGHPNGDLIKQVTLWVLQRALAQNNEWTEIGVDLSMAVNLSARNLQDNTFPDEVGEVLRGCQSSQLTRLRFEITETAMMADPARAAEILNALGAMGIRLSIDDFGTGYSSLAYLKQLPVAELKIDKSFVIGMALDENDATIVRSTIDLAHNIGLRVVAEGVEDKRTYEMLGELGCDAVQGYYISRPVEPQELLRWLQQPPWGLRDYRGDDSA